MGLKYEMGLKGSHSLGIC